MPQIARPDSDVSAGTWITAPLWSRVDEAAADDGDLIESAATPSNSTCEVALSDLSDPSSSSGHIIRARRRKSGIATTGWTLAVRLKEGATTRATLSTDANSDTFATASYTLSAAEADSITDYTNLRLEFVANGAVLLDRVQVSWAEFEVPNALGGGRTRTGAG